MSRRQPDKTRRRARNGFTLLEVLVAFVILGITLVALYGQFFTGLRAVRTSDAVAAAVGLARSKLEAVGVSEPLRFGETAGRFDNGYQWRTAVTPYKGALALGRYDVVAPYQVAVTVSWPDSPRARSVTLSAIRLAPQAQGRRR